MNRHEQDLVTTFPNWSKWYTTIPSPLPSCPLQKDWVLFTLPRPQALSSTWRKHMETQSGSCRKNECWKVNIATFLPRTTKYCSVLRLCVIIGASSWCERTWRYLEQNRFSLGFTLVFPVIYYWLSWTRLSRTPRYLETTSRYPWTFGFLYNNVTILKEFSPCSHSCCLFYFISMRITNGIVIRSHAGGLKKLLKPATEQV